MQKGSAQRTKNALQLNEGPLFLKTTELLKATVIKSKPLIYNHDTATLDVDGLHQFLLSYATIRGNSTDEGWVEVGRVRVGTDTTVPRRRVACEA